MIQFLPDCPSLLREKRVSNKRLINIMASGLVFLLVSFLPEAGHIVFAGVYGRHSFLHSRVLKQWGVSPPWGWGSILGLGKGLEDSNYWNNTLVNVYYLDCTFWLKQSWKMFVCVSRRGGRRWHSDMLKKGVWEKKKVGDHWSKSQVDKINTLLHFFFCVLIAGTVGLR